MICAIRPPVFSVFQEEKIEDARMPEQFYEMAIVHFPEAEGSENKLIEISTLQIRLRHWKSGGALHESSLHSDTLLTQHGLSRATPP